MVVHKILDAAEATADQPVHGAHAVGSRVRELRKAQGRTLQDLSAAAGISIGHLSEIERDLASVPIGVLSTLAAELGVHLHWFFEDGTTSHADSDVVVRAGHGRRLSFPGIGISDELLSPNLLGPLEVVRSTLVPGADSDYYTHDGHEVGVVVEGTLDLWIGERHLRLRRGDSFGFPSTEPHRCANTTTRPTVVLWIVTPPHY